MSEITDKLTSKTLDASFAQHLKNALWDLTGCFKGSIKVSIELEDKDMDVLERVPEGFLCPGLDTLEFKRKS